MIVHLDFFCVLHQAFNANDPTINFIDGQANLCVVAVLPDIIIKKKGKYQSSTNKGNKDCGHSRSFKVSKADVTLVVVHMSFAHRICRL